MFMVFEWISGIIVYDVINLRLLKYVIFVYNCKFVVNLEDLFKGVGDLGLEGLVFVLVV